MTSVAIPTTLPAEDQPPKRQTHLTKDELRNKTATMLDNASIALKEYWDNLTHYGNSVIPIPRKSRNESSSYKDHASDENFVNATVKDLESNEKPFALLKKEFKFYCCHIYRRRNFLSVMKCQLFEKDSQ